MTKDDLILRLRAELGSMIEWAREVSDEYLDGDPETRQQYAKDLEKAIDAMRLNADT